MSEQITDLQGKTLRVGRIVLGPGSYVFKNGTIEYDGNGGGSSTHLGLFELIQGKWWNGVAYPRGPIDIRFENLTLDGGFDYNSGIQEHNRVMAIQAKKHFSAVTVGTFPARSVVFENCQLKNFGGAGWAGESDNFRWINSRAHRVAGIVIGCRSSWGNKKATIDGVMVSECGSVFDFTDTLTKTNRFLDKPDIASVKNILATDITGRTKNHSPNWIVTGERWKFSQSSMLNFNASAAFDLASTPIAFDVSGIEIDNFWACGIATYFDGFAGWARMRNVSVTNSLRVAKVQQPHVGMDGVFAEGCHSMWQSGVPSHLGTVVAHQIGDDQRWVDHLKEIQKMLRVFNDEHGTNYNANVWLPDSLTRLM